MAQNDTPLTVVYQLMIQCVRPHIGVIASYTATNPFPPVGEHLELLDCDPTTWDVHDTITRIFRDGDALFCLTLLLVDSPVLDNSDRRPLEQ